MKYCIAVTEILTRYVAVDKESLEDAISYVRDAYDAQKIILDSGDLAPDPATGEPASFSEADWIDRDDAEKMEAVNFEAA